MNRVLRLALAFSLVSLMNPSIAVAWSNTNRCVHYVGEEAIHCPERNENSQMGSNEMALNILIAKK